MKSQSRPRQQSTKVVADESGGVAGMSLEKRCTLLGERIESGSGLRACAGGKCG